MTKIKFRAYDPRTREFYYTNQVYDDHNFSFCDSTLRCFGWIEERESFRFDEAPEYITYTYECSPVEMFTGKLDEDEKEIYEGDIVDFTVFDCFGGDEQYRGYVVFTGQRYQLWNKPDSEYYGDDGGFDLDWVCYQDDTLKVIGNINQNPELIEEGK